MTRRYLFQIQVLWILALLFIFTGTTFAADKLPGEYRMMDEAEIHTKGKVVLLEFADFYCFKRGEDEIRWHDGIKSIKDRVHILDWVVPEVSSSEIWQNPEKFDNFLTDRLRKSIKGS